MVAELVETTAGQPPPDDELPSDPVALVQYLRRLALSASTDAEARRVTSQIVQLDQRYRALSALRRVPAGPAEQARELDPKYVIRPHTQFISDRIAQAVQDVANGRSRYLIINTPPRVGKSRLTSVETPLWIFRQHPEWKLALVSYSDHLTHGWAREIRTKVEDHREIGVAIRRDGGAVGDWFTVQGGEFRARAIRTGLTGLGAKVLIVDDPLKDHIEAHSLAARDLIWNWYLSVAQTRLEPPSLTIITMCMTGDTPVLRPDGTETPLRDIRPGDEIATFTDEGEVTTSVVSNWASQGVDDTFAVHLASGRVVRANARHPFWVVGEDGNGSWVRLESLRAGMRVRCLTEPTEGSSARQMTATSPRSARACACPTTREHAMQPVTGLRRRLMRVGGRSDSRVGTASLPRTTIDSSLSKVSVARSAEDTSVKSPSPRTGPRFSASITATTPELCEVCSATTATSSLLAGTRPTSFDGPLSTSVVSTDEIVSIVPSGREEVFDIEVVGTHRFIANGLDVSNTRWHEDDLVGRLLSKEYPGNPDDWEVVRLPALAEENDPLARVPGQPLLSPIIAEDEGQALKRWSEIENSVGSYAWSGMFQQHPSPAKGTIFNMDWWRYWTVDPEKVTLDEKGNPDGRVVLFDPQVHAHAGAGGGHWIDSWDLTFKGSSSSDFVVGQRWVKIGDRRYLAAQFRDRVGFTASIEQLRQWNGAEASHLNPYGGPHISARLVEDKANGPAVIETLQAEIPTLRAVEPRGSKEDRARAASPDVSKGRVYLPHPMDPGNQWVQALLAELRQFPFGANDDQVDSLTQALGFLRDRAGQAGAAIPGKAASAAGAGLQGRSVARTAAAQSGRTSGRIRRR